MNKRKNSSKKIKSKKRTKSTGNHTKSEHQKNGKEIRSLSTKVRSARKKSTKKKSIGGGISSHHKTNGIANLQSIQIIGNRDYQEDEYFIISNINDTKNIKNCEYNENLKISPEHIIIAGIFDGHGGGTCSKWVSNIFQKIIVKTIGMLHKSKYKILINHMLENEYNRNEKNFLILIKSLEKHYPSEKLKAIVYEDITMLKKLNKINDFLYEDLMKKAIHKISEKWDAISIPKIKDKRNKYTCGTTVLITLVVGHTVHIMWIGDSRTIWKVDSDTSVYSTKDHKPNKDDLMNGAFIKNDRVNGVLAVGRAIGDNGKKTRGALKRTPSYIHYEYKNKTDIIMGSDGVYDKLNNNRQAFDHSFIQKIQKQKQNDKKDNFFTDNTTFIKLQMKH